MENIKLSIVGKKPTQEEIDRYNSISKPKVERPKIDAYFLQEISDRLYGPDAMLYFDELNKLHKKIRKREGKYGGQFNEQSRNII